MYYFSVPHIMKIENVNCIKLIGNMHVHHTFWKPVCGWCFRRRYEYSGSNAS